MRRVVRNVPRQRRYVALAILALAVAAAAALTSGSVSAPFAGAATADTCGYAGGTTPAATVPRASQKFNEIGIIEGFSVTSATDGTPLTVNTFYSDEHALTLGQPSPNPTTWTATYNASGGTTASSTTPLRADDAGSNPAGVGASNPAAITPGSVSTGDPLATDPGGRAVQPALYLTDVTSDASSKAGDWQSQSGPNTTAQFPDYVGGTWKNNGAANPLGSDGKVATNGSTNLGPHSEAFVRNIASAQGLEAYAAEVRWDVASLESGGQALKPGHTYRVQMMFHDGDHTADTGEACTTFTMPPAHPTGDTDASIDNGGVLSGDPLSVATRDTAHLSNGTANAGPNTAAATDTSGRLIFRLYKQAGTTTNLEARCRGGTLTTAPVATSTIDADSGAETTTDYTSDDVALTEPGLYHWTVQYTGNTENAPFAETACNNGRELVEVKKAPSETNTTPRVKITEDVNIKLSASASAGIKANDTVTIKLFKDAGGCTAANHATGGTQFGNTVTKTIAAGDIGANGQVNLGQLVYPDDFGGASAAALSSGTYWWFVRYNGNSQVEASDDDCTEQFSITLP
jgi:hypothetical protein